MYCKMRILFHLILVATVLFGCAVVDYLPGSPSAVAKGYIAQGRASEKAGDWVEAARYYRLALAVEPQNQQIADSLKRVQAKRLKLAEAHYRKGLGYLRQGKYSDGQRQFLMTLRYWPQHKGAREKLKPRTQIKTKRYILHTVQKGETISIISKKYYDDPMQFQTIARFNNLPDATTVRVGKELKIPEIDGVPFLVPEGTPEITTDGQAMERQLAAPDSEQREAQQTEDVQADAQAFDNMVANYRDAGLQLFHEKKYDEAVIEFKKVVNADPQDFKTQEYLFKAHFSSAQDLLKEKQYQAADKQLQACLDFRTDCLQCRPFIKQCEDSYKELHYQLGIQYFGEEKLENAIGEWQLVKKIDPHYKQVQENIRRAERISTKIQQLKKESKP
ncbi:MAG: LysM peptidoglycan-binding domain-containing protein [Deltaproteobacteria bacterium]|jgi:tetratricopeptide (TPR) repeat protein|nr:LysM peptidoglycan-binding domain-containing protein [Deltaproteobacteria bacterium]